MHDTDLTQWRVDSLYIIKCPGGFLYPCFKKTGNINFNSVFWNKKRGWGFPPFNVNVKK